MTKPFVGIVSNARAASQSLKSSENSYKGAHDLVVLVVGLTYVQAIADEARVETAEAQVKTAQALNDQASDQLKAGTSPAELMCCRVRCGHPKYA